MSGKVEKFDKRLGRVSKKHRAMSRGYSFRVEKTGLISVRPRRSGVGFPLGAIALILGVGILFKGVVFANYGPEKYHSKVELLQSGTVVEKAGAWLLQPGKPTYVVASMVGGFIR
ncbi:hypothetical protein KO498_04065 [Lentibacter algarum]|uniref:hypothetical protein n=1 Tax=Lentibacter algarum TaxID=576131 RepID=UPI001C07BD36|nr:hypothetical protein [Lentibacter algarum]MBU2980983.1 hypothetical protein [Lentibacter algarum]